MPHASETSRSLLLGSLAVLTLVPVTLPVTVLRALVQERFEVSELLTSLFMSINMIGAALAAPLAGALADRIGRRRPLIVAALACDALALFSLSLDLPFSVFLGLRFLEGCAHIAALSLLMTVASHSFDASRRGRAMGIVGGGLTLGVALGAPLGGVVGRTDPLHPLYLGAALLALAAVLARVGLPEVRVAEARPSLREIGAALNRHRLLIAPFAFSFADRFTVGFFTTTFSLYLSRIHDLDAPRIGLLIALFMLPFALLSYPFGRLAETRSRLVMVCGGSLVYGVGTASLTWWSAETLPVLMVLLGATSAVMFVPSLILATDTAPGEIRGTTLGGFNAAGSLGFIAGPLTGGLVSQTVAGIASWEAGYRAAFLVAGAAEILCVALTLPLLLRARPARLEAAAATPGADGAPAASAGSAPGREPPEG